MIFSDSKLIQIFCDYDDFCKYFEQWQKSRMLHEQGSVRHTTRAPGLSLSEIMCIMMVYHHSEMKCFEYYYHEIVEKEMKPWFPNIPCYERFVQLIPRSTLAFL